MYRLFLLAAAGACFAQQAPVPPCAGEAFPQYPEAGQAPVVKVWERDPEWTAPPCTGWKEPGFGMLVALAGRFRSAEGSSGLLRRIGAISQLQGVRYWSTTHQGWRTLITGASAVEDATGNHRRGDFAPEEFVAGRSLYFEQEDNVTGKATYQLRVNSISPDRMVFEIENTSTMRYLFVPVFRPGEMRSIYYLEHEKPDVWRFYSMTRTGPGASSLATGHDASSINRAVAMYRHLAGIPTDQEPPAAR
jgi:hypothetical protein